MRRLRAVILGVTVLAGGLLPSIAHGAPSPPPTPLINKLAVYMLENTSQAAAYAGMPYLSSLAAAYGKATNYTDVTHPSEGNYVTLVSGQGARTCGLADPTPGQCNQPGPTVFGQAIGAGDTAKLYQEGMDTNCSASGDYGHNPWLHFPSEATLCAQFDVPMGEPSGGNLDTDIASGSLPTLSMIVPDDSNNAHDGSLATADSYLHDWMTRIFAGPDWNSGHLAVVVTFDEGETTEDVAYVVVAPTVPAGTVLSTPADHNATERLYASVAGVPPINGGATATDLAGGFNLQGGQAVPPPTTASTSTTTTTATVSPATTTSTTAAVPPGSAPPSAGTTRHYTANEDTGYDASHTDGFNLHDTGADRSTIDSLPGSDQALVWLGEKCPTGVSHDFAAAVSSLSGDAKVFGYYLSDEPDPNACPQGPANLAAEADYIHAHNPGQTAFAVIDDTPGAWAAYAPARSHLDEVGMDPYPCRRDSGTCDVGLIDRNVLSAESAGIPQSRIVPVFQTFGDATWFMPSAAQLGAILDEWTKLVPGPLFDYAYSWGCQSGSLSNCLETDAAARDVVASHNAAPGPPVPPTTAAGTTTTTVAPEGSTSDSTGDSGDGQHNGWESDWTWAPPSDESTPSASPELA